MIFVHLVGLEYLFLVGGFAESPILQFEIRKEFENRVKIVIPQEVSLTILKGTIQRSLTGVQCAFFRTPEASKCI